MSADLEQERSLDCVCRDLSGAEGCLTQVPSPRDGLYDVTGAWGPSACKSAMKPGHRTLRAGNMTIGEVHTQTGPQDSGPRAPLVPIQQPKPQKELHWVWSAKPQSSFQKPVVVMTDLCSWKALGNLQSNPTI